MNTKMTFGGIGPKLALISFPYIILALTVIRRDPEFLKFDIPGMEWIVTAGYAWIAIGLFFYVATIVVFMAGFKKEILVTRGTFGLCRNPIYA